MVTLPKKWVREMGLRQSSEITIERSGNKSLVITVENTAVPTERREVALHVAESLSTDSLVRKIVSFYLLGYNLINIKSEMNSLNTLQRNAIKNVVRKYLIGTEIVVDSNEGILLQVLLGYSSISVDSALRRMLLISTSMHREAIQALGAFNRDLPRTISERDDEIDRFRLFITRQLNTSVDQGIFKDIGFESTDLLGYSQIVIILEKVADMACRIALEVSHVEGTPERQVCEKLSEMSEHALKLLDMSLLALFKRDHVAADEVLEKTNSIGELKDRLITKIEEGRQSTDRVISIMNYLEETCDYAKDISEIVLDMTAEKSVRKEIGKDLAEPIVAGLA